MDSWRGLNWGSYFHDLSDEEVRDLANWLSAEFLEVWEFTDIVDRMYVQAADTWRARPPAFVAGCGRPAVTRYARRKRHFTEITAAHDEARLRGALPGEVTPEELQPLRPPHTRRPSVEHLIGVLEIARGEPP